VKVLFLRHVNRETAFFFVVKRDPSSLNTTSLAVSPDIYALYIKYGSIACNVMGDHVGGIH
jgi:hypothetical protein